MICVGVNGCGRIGLNVIRASLMREDVEVVAINDIATAEEIASRLANDPIRGELPGVRVDRNGYIWNGKRWIRSSSCQEPSEIPWREAGVQVVIEATGRYRDARARDHITCGGAGRVIISASADDVDATLVYGVSHRNYDPARHFVISPASCGVNALAILAEVLSCNYGLVTDSAQADIILARQSYQRDVDIKAGASRGDVRLGRSARNIVAHDHIVGALLGEAIPALGNVLLDGWIVNAPIGSAVTLGVELVQQPKDAAELNAVMAVAAREYCRGVLDYGPMNTLVSGDVSGNPASCLFDPSHTQICSGRVKVRGWFDGEWGFSNRLLDLARLMATPDEALAGAGR